VGGYLSFTPTTLYVETECLPPPSNGEANKVKSFRTSSCPVDSLNLNHLSSPLEGEETGGGVSILHPHHTLRRNRVSASPLKWGGEQGEILSHQLLPCGLAFSTASLTGIGQRAHQLALRAKRCSLLVAPAPLILPRCPRYQRLSKTGDSFPYVFPVKGSNGNEHYYCCELTCLFTPRNPGILNKCTQPFIGEDMRPSGCRKKPPQINHHHCLYICHSNCEDN
jgi:hypothetical protein